MEQDTFKLLSSFVVRTRKVTGAVDSTKLVEDPEYASEIFKKVDEEGDEDLVLLAISLRQALAAESGIVKPAPAVVTKESSAPKDKYMFGARG